MTDKDSDSVYAEIKPLGSTAPTQQSNEGEKTLNLLFWLHEKVNCRSEKP